MLFSTKSIVLVLIYFQIVESSNSIEISKANNQNVVLTVYYESLCPDSRRFITTKLTPLHPDIKDFVDLKLKPFGKANV